MKQVIDCLFIGHNESNLPVYEQDIRKMGTDSGAYRDLDLSFIRYGNRLFSAPEIFNLFYTSDKDNPRIHQPLKIAETFSAAIAYLGTYLSRQGYTFDYVNSFQDEQEELARKLEQENIRTIAVITTLYVAVFPILEIMDFIKKHNHQAKIIIGGPFVSNQVRALTETEVEFLFKSIGADFYVNSSQGEATLVHIIKSLKNHLPLEQINNIYFKKGNRYVKTPILKENNRLADNMVDWNLFSHRTGKFVNVRTSISCPFSCAFCGFPEHAGAYQTAGIEEIGRELTSLAKIESVECVQFIDDTFNVPVKRFKEILRMMIKNKYKNRYRFQWNSHFRCQFADRETIELMKESGCEGVFLGIESGSNQILENMNKAATVEKYQKGIQLLNQYGILTYGSFIIGFPGETHKTVTDTIEFIKESGIDFYRAQLWYCDTITPIWKQKKQYKINGSQFEWSHHTMDAKTACDIIDEIFLTIETPTWVPQYNFECDSIFHLLHRGIPLPRIKKFLNSFNQGIREKLKNPSQIPVSFDVIRRLKKYCIPPEPGKSPSPVDDLGEKDNRENRNNRKNTKEMDAFDVGFDY